MNNGTTTAIEQRQGRSLSLTPERKTKAPLRTVNDLVEELHLALLGDKDADYIKLLDATEHADTVTGKCEMDDVLAAQVIIKRAEDVGSPVAGVKISTVVKAINLVLRRYGESRKDRRYMLNGTNQAAPVQG